MRWPRRAGSRSPRSSVPPVLDYAVDHDCDDHRSDLSMKVLACTRNSAPLNWGKLQTVNDQDESESEHQVAHYASGGRHRTQHHGHNATPRCSLPEGDRRYGSGRVTEPGLGLTCSLPSEDRIACMFNRPGPSRAWEDGFQTRPYGVNYHAVGAPGRRRWPYQGRGGPRPRSRFGRLRAGFVGDSSGRQFVVCWQVQGRIRGRGRGGGFQTRPYGVNYHAVGNDGADGPIKVAGDPAPGPDSAGSGQASSGTPQATVRSLLAGSVAVAGEGGFQTRPYGRSGDCGVSAEYHPGEVILFRARGVGRAGIRGMARLVELARNTLFPQRLT